MRVFLGLAFIVATPSWEARFYSNLGPQSPCPHSFINAEYQYEFHRTGDNVRNHRGGRPEDIVLPLLSVHSLITFGLYTNSDRHAGTLLES